MRGLALLPIGVGLLVTLPLLRFALLPLLPWFGPVTAPPPGEAPSLLPAIGNTLLLAALTSACATPPAIGIAMLLQRRRWAGRSALLAALLLLFLLPGYVVAAGWEIVAAAVPAVRPALLGWPGLVMVSTLKAMPVATVAIAGGWMSVPLRLEEATRLHVAHRWRRVRLALHAIAPAIRAGALLVFVETSHDYGLASTLGARLHLDLLVTEVYASLAAWPISWTRAATAGDVLMALGLAPLLLRFLFGGGAVAHDRGGQSERRRASAGEHLAGLLATGVLLALGVGVPLAALIGEACAAEGAAVPPEAWASLLYSVLYAFVAATFAVGLACAMLGTTGRSGRLTAILAWLPLGNLAVPAIVLGAAQVIAFNGGWLPLMGTPLALLLALVATQYPVLALLLRAPARARTASGAEAALVHGVRFLDRVERLILPPLIQPLSLAWAVAFGRVFFELPLAQMLAPPSREPVAVALVQLQQGFRFAAEARLALAALAVGAASVGIVLFAGRDR